MPTPSPTSTEDRASRAAARTPGRVPSSEELGVRTQDPRMLWQLELVRRYAALDTPVLIQGETGTGKELTARALHHLSPRAAGPMVTVDCGALPESLIESELFGHERGAFTGADRHYGGRIEAASGGTLFLDEINSVSLAMQAKLLRFLEIGEFCRPGRERPVPVTVRIVCATNVPLEQLVDEGRMRRDFYYRLSVLRLELPPLRDRLDDIPLLVRQFLEETDDARRLGVVDVSDELLAELRTRRWPGNVRELRNALRRAVALSNGDPVLHRLADDVVLRESATAPAGAPSEPAPAEPADRSTFRAWIREREREYFVSLLERGGSIGEQSALSGLPERTLYRKLKALGLGGAAGGRGALDRRAAATSTPESDG